MNNYITVGHLESQIKKNSPKNCRCITNENSFTPTQGRHRTIKPA